MDDEEIIKIIKKEIIINIFFSSKLKFYFLNF